MSEWGWLTGAATLTLGQCGRGAGERESGTSLAEMDKSANSHLLALEIPGAPTGTQPGHACG